MVGHVMLDDFHSLLTPHEQEVSTSGMDLTHHLEFHPGVSHTLSLALAVPVSQCIGSLYTAGAQGLAGQHGRACTVGNCSKQEPVRDFTASREMHNGAVVSVRALLQEN